MDPNQSQDGVAAPAPPQRSSAVASTSSSSSSAPLKLTFRLGGASSHAAASTSTSISNPNPDPIPPASSATFLIPTPAPYASPSSSPWTSTAPLAQPPSTSAPIPLAPTPSGSGSGSGSGNGNRSAPATPITTSTSSRASSVALSTGPGDAPPKKKQRKPTVKRAPGEAGPGKHWRKGLKGTIVAGQPLPPRPVNAADSPASDSASLPAPIEISTPRTSFPIAPSLPGAPAVKASGAAPFLPALPLETRTPAPRRWNRAVIAIKSLRGGWLKLPTWEGHPKSDYAAYKTSLNPPPPPPPVIDVTPGPTGTAGGNAMSQSPSIDPLSPAVLLSQASPLVAPLPSGSAGTLAANPDEAGGAVGTSPLKVEQDAMGDTVMASV
ncbi:BZ3500_MvSof-1268-A1-R1_Chr6-3g08806 [Microbotryum saponariae]|uniref:BZ3500_MvSof-1268-A1-R1_Chr6-3g08806 protein n=1 Tax=Microbotryum saponariae TaxID=289078 RepID=A0A2X0MP60_9BASI|nr:BZ3500_MvSof-1268-A1-R1_Chr6-3g08806 [Microbotryum saponariae]SDA07407.1 BZ3501_MvSof-1269-A2-R1_Chr6-2g08509 [Microbotryum saponariae]